MELFLEFFANHTVLFAALVAIIGALVWTTLGPGAGTRKVTPAAATQMINNADAAVLDVRGEGEFNEGHIVNAIHIPLNSLAERLDKLQKYRDRPVIATCRSGQQAAAACATLRKNGFEKAVSLSGGILAWQDANLPLTKK